MPCPGVASSINKAARAAGGWVHGGTDRNGQKRWVSGGRTGGGSSVLFKKKENRHGFLAVKSFSFILMAVRIDTPPFKMVI
jgi:hypothetical protein